MQPTVRITYQEYKELLELKQAVESGRRLSVRECGWKGKYRDYLTDSEICGELERENHKLQSRVDNLEYQVNKVKGFSIWGFLRWKFE